MISMSQHGTTYTAPATSNAIRGAEQSGNIAKQWFARKRWVRGLTWQYGGHDIASGRYRSLGIAKERASSKAKIVVISRV